MFRHVTTRLAGLIILIAGIWGGLIPFVGPYFHFTLGPDRAWTWTTGRLWLSVLPAAAAVLGGLILMGGGPRLSGRFGALLALAGGAWFAIGPDVSMLWNHGVSQQGVAHGHHTITRMLEYLTLHSGLGVLIVAFAAYALPGVTTVVAERRVGRDAELAGAGAAAGAAAEHHHDRRVAEREGVAAAGAGAGAGYGAGRAGTATAEEPVGRERDGVARDEDGSGGQPYADGPAREGDGVAPADGAAQPADGQGQTTTRRRGGLAGLFSRR